MTVQSRWYKSGWDEARKAKQREAIHRWKPWEKSTGPRTEEGKAESAANGATAHWKRLSSRELIKLIKWI
jgi:hypothetical protein